MKLPEELADRLHFKIYGDVNCTPDNECYNDCMEHHNDNLRRFRIKVVEEIKFIQSDAIADLKEQLSALEQDKRRLDWLEKNVLASGYPVELRQGKEPPTYRVCVEIGKHSGPWSKCFVDYNLRTAIDSALKTHDGSKT